MSDTLVIIGLGNWPEEYHQTRHNVGFMVIDQLCAKINISLDKKQHEGLVGAKLIAGKKIVLAKPLTYMNLSGNFVSSFLSYYNITHEDIIIICDDADTPIGKIRLKESGGAAGQNGLDNIINNLRTKDIKRIRVGIGRPTQGALKDHVLGKFNSQEKPLITQAIEKAVLACEDIIKGKTFNQTMSKFNSEL